ncbi:MAG TPA: pentapeptide repeat-containing protein [Coleofasciculaceae cyanobacterium]
MPQDFTGQNLRGQCFRGLDLTEASFYKADIRGADFSNAILRGADFSNVKAGLRLPWLILIAGIGLLLVAAGLLVATNNIVSMVATGQAPDGSEIPDNVDAVADSLKNVMVPVTAMATLSGAIMAKIAIALTTKPASQELGKTRPSFGTMADIGALAHLLSLVLIALGLKNIWYSLDLLRIPNSYAAGLLDDFPFADSAFGILAASFLLLIGATATTIFSTIKTRSRNQTRFLIATGVGAIAGMLVGVFAGASPITGLVFRPIVSFFFIIALFTFFPTELLTKLPFIGHYLFAAWLTVIWALFGAIALRIPRIPTLVPLITFLIGLAVGATVEGNVLYGSMALLAIALIAVVCSFILVATQTTSFRGADLTHANFQKAALRYADFTKATLENTDFSRAEV